MKDEFNAKMLGRVGRGQLTEVKLLKRTLRWHEKEMCFSWSGGTRYVTELGVQLGLTDTRAVTKTLTPGTKATGGGARDALEPLDTFQAATFRSAVGLVGYIVLDRPDCQYAAKAVRSATREPTKLDWMRLAKFLAAHSELEWLHQAQALPEKYVVYGDSDWAGSETRRRTTGAFEQLGQHPTEFSCSTQHVVALSSGEAELPATRRAAGVAVSSAVCRGWDGSEAGSAYGQHGEPWHPQPCCSGRVRHLDVKWLWTQEAVRAGRISLKKVGTYTKVSDLTTKHHDEERLKVLMTLGRL